MFTRGYFINIGDNPKFTSRAMRSQKNMPHIGWPHLTRMALGPRFPTNPDTGFHMNFACKSHALSQWYPHVWCLQWFDIPICLISPWFSMISIISIHIFSCFFGHQKNCGARGSTAVLESLKHLAYAKMWGVPSVGIMTTNLAEISWSIYIYICMAVCQNPGTPGEHQNSW